MLLIHSIFVVAFIIFFFLFTLHTVSVFWIRYKIDIWQCRQDDASLGSGNMFYFENVVARMTLICNNGFLIH